MIHCVWTTCQRRWVCAGTKSSFIMDYVQEKKVKMHEISFSLEVLFILSQYCFLLSNDWTLNNWGHTLMFWTVCVLFLMCIVIILLLLSPPASQHPTASNMKIQWWNSKLSATINSSRVTGGLFYDPKWIIHGMTHHSCCRWSLN